MKRKEKAALFFCNTFPLERNFLRWVPIVRETENSAWVSDPIHGEIRFRKSNNRIDFAREDGTADMDFHLALMSKDALDRNVYPWMKEA